MFNSLCFYRTNYNYPIAILIKCAFLFDFVYLFLMTTSNLDMNNQQINSVATQQISAAQFGAKYKSKREVFMLLSVQAKAYLPRYEHVTI